MEEALFLTRFATKVTVIHRRDAFRASKIMLERAQKHEKIKFLLNTVVEDVYDHEKKEVTGLKVRNLKTGEVSDFPTSALFLGIGHDPNAKMFAGQLDMDDDGYLKTHKYVFTQSPRSLRLRRRAGPPLSPGHHRSRKRLHGRNRSGKIPGRAARLNGSRYMHYRTTV